MTEKTRLDAALVERGLCTGRDRAKGIIMAGQVYVNNQKADKPGMTISPEDQIEVRGDQLAYVSRGGLKLEKAMKEFGLRLDGCICADIGASTGGFTDCMLQNGAVKVYAIDVGYGQLAWNELSIWIAPISAMLPKKRYRSCWILLRLMFPLFRSSWCCRSCIGC